MAVVSTEILDLFQIYSQNFVFIGFNYVNSELLHDVNGINKEFCCVLRNIFYSIMKNLKLSDFD